MKPFPLKCLPSNLVHESDQRVASPMVPSAISLPYRWARLVTNTTKPEFKLLGSGTPINPETYRKHLIQPQVSCGGRRGTSQHVPSAVPTIGWTTLSLGTGCAFSPPAPRCARDSCLGGSVSTHKALEAPSPCQPGRGAACPAVSSPAGLPAAACPGKQRKRIAFHFNKSQMMPFANYQNGAKVKNPLNYNTCHGPKLL